MGYGIVICSNITESLLTLTTSVSFPNINIIFPQIVYFFTDSSLTVIILQMLCDLEFIKTKIGSKEFVLWSDMAGVWPLHKGFMFLFC